MRLVSIDCETDQVRRYDTDLPHVEPTHFGRIIGAAGIEARVEYFRLFPPDICAVEAQPEVCAA